MITLLFFAGMEEKAGVSKIEVDFEGRSIRDLKKWTELSYELGEGALSHTMTAINEEFSNDDDIVKAHDTVAFIPPVSGG